MAIEGLSARVIDSSVNLDLAAGQRTANESPAPKTNMSLVHKAVRDLNQNKAMGQNTELTFALDRDSRRPVIRVINRDTKEVLMQLPPEYALRLAAETRKLL